MLSFSRWLAVGLALVATSSCGSADSSTVGASSSLAPATTSVPAIAISQGDGYFSFESEGNRPGRWCWTLVAGQAEIEHSCADLISTRPQLVSVNSRLDIQPVRQRYSSEVSVFLFSTARQVVSVSSVPALPDYRVEIGPYGFLIYVVGSVPVPQVDLILEYDDGSVSECSPEPVGPFCSP